MSDAAEIIVVLKDKILIKLLITDAFFLFPLKIIYRFYENGSPIFLLVWGHVQLTNLSTMLRFSLNCVNRKYSAIV